MRVAAGGGGDCRSNGVVDDVISEVFEDLIAPHRTIVKPVLPECSGSTQRPIDLEGSAALCPGNDPAEFGVGQELKHPVNVIGHDDETEVVADLFDIAFPNFRNDDSGCCGRLEHTTSPIAPRRDHVDSIGF